MTCRELAEKVMAYRDGELPLMGRLSLQFHAAICPCCRALLGSYDLTVELAGELGSVEVPPAVALEFDAMILAAMQAPPES
jgi:hypothetical protein